MEAPEAAPAAGRKVLLFGWGAAAEQVLKELSRFVAKAEESSPIVVCCISQTSQAKDCDLQDVCASLGFECVLLDSNAEILKPL
eukprot:g3938.t1